LVLLALATEVQAQNTRLIGEVGRNRTPSAVARLLQEANCNRLWVSKAIEDSKSVISRGRVILKTDSCESEPPQSVAARSKQLLAPQRVRRAVATPSKPVENLTFKLTELEKKLAESDQEAARLRQRVSSFEKAERERIQALAPPPASGLFSRMGSWFRGRWEALKNLPLALKVFLSLVLLALIAFIMVRRRSVRRRNYVPASSRVETRREATSKT
jgi:hypothetical protein